MGSPRAVFAALDEHESGWLAEADLGTALERAGVSAGPAEVLAALAPTQEEAGFLSVDEFCSICAGRAATPQQPPAEGGTTAAAPEGSAAGVGQQDAAGGEGTPRERALAAALAAARAENAGLRRRLEMGGDRAAAAPAPAARAGAAGPLWDAGWLAQVRPLYDEHMGCENMGPLLYALVRFVKPRRVLEVGAGYTTLFILQALADNEAELAALRNAGAAGPLPVAEGGEAAAGEEEGGGWYVDGAAAAPPVLHCVDNQEHCVFTDLGGLGAVMRTAEELGLGALLKVHTADAFELLLRQGAEGGGGALPTEDWDMVWLDGITTDDRWPDFFTAIWERVTDKGGLALVHSTLTNAINRQWLYGLIEDAREGGGGARGGATLRFRPDGPLEASEIKRLAEEICTASIPGVAVSAPASAAAGKAVGPGEPQEPEAAGKVEAAAADGASAATTPAAGLRLRWLGTAPRVEQIGFGLSTLELDCELTLGDAAPTAEALEAAAAAVAEALQGVLGAVQGVEVGAVRSAAALRDLAHIGLLEPHKRYQNSVSLFARREQKFREPLYSWTP